MVERRRSISPDRKASTDFSDVIKQELEDNEKYQQFRLSEEPEKAQLHLDQVLTSPFNTTFPLDYVKDEFLPALSLPSGALDGSSESLKHEGVAGSPCGSLMEGTPQISSEESYKHEGLAETPETSPESLSFSPKKSEEPVREENETTKLETPREIHLEKEHPSTKDVPDGSEEQGAAVTEGTEPSAECLLKEATLDPSKDTSSKQEGDYLDSNSVSLAKETPKGLAEEASCDEGQPTYVSSALKTQTDTEAQGSICYRYIFIDFLVSFLCGAYKNVFILFPILKAIFFLNVGSCLTIIYLSIHSSISIHLSSIYLSIHLYLSIYHLSILLSALKSCYSVISYIAFSYQGSKVLLTLFLCKFVSLLLRFSLCFFFPAI